ncbi:MAG: glycosyltransferase family 39 protein, partial [Planctomycetaceae bacterium]|nr:glycosyltransferase family 39 protein [Planctomycetaceae bacterium]
MSWDGPQLPSADADASAQDHLRPLTRKRSTAASELPLDSLPAARLPEGTDPTVQFFWGLLIAHVVLWTLLPILMHHNPSRETLHLLTLGRQWEWGYHQQPPLPAWLAIASCALTGTAVWPTYLLSAVAGAVCLWAAWRMGREFLRPWTAVCGAIAMEACFYFNYTAPTLTSETLARTFWALAVLTFYWAINKNRRTHWVQMAVCLGLGLLCRYDTFLLFAALFAFTLWSDRARRCWDTSRPFLAAGVIAAVFLPHGWWLTSHVREIGSSMLDYLVATEQVAQTTDRWFIQLAALIPVLVVLAPLVNWFNPPEEETDEDRDFMKQYLVWISILPPATTIVLAVMNGFHIDALWASPLWIYGGVLFLMWSRLEESRFSWRQALTWTGTASGIIAASLFATYVLFPPSLEKGQEVHFPGRSLAAAVNKTWKEKYPDQKLPAVGGPWWLAENAAWYSSDRPTVYGDLDSRENSVRDKHKLEESGGIVILDATAAPSAAEEQFLTQLTNPQISLPI